MKNRFRSFGIIGQSLCKRFGIIAVVAMMGFFMIACGNIDSCPGCRNRGSENWGNWVVANQPADTEAGVETRTCSQCNATTQTRPYWCSHSTLGPWLITAQPTATEAGVETRICSQCNATQTRSFTGITWSATANSTTTTTAINFTFSYNLPSGFTSAHISVNPLGDTQITTGSWQSSSRSLAVTVVTPGNVSVSINHPEFSRGPQTVSVFSQ